MHENGRRLVTKQYRDDGSGKEVLVYTADVEYYSFQQAGAYWVMANDSVTIQVRRSVCRPGVSSVSGTEKGEGVGLAGLLDGCLTLGGRRLGTTPWEALVVLSKTALVSRAAAGIEVAPLKPIIFVHSHCYGGSLKGAPADGAILLIVR